MTISLKSRLTQMHTVQTRMHSSRMRTVRNSNRLLSGGVSTHKPPPEQAPPGAGTPPGADTDPREQTAPPREQNHRHV